MATPQTTDTPGALENWQAGKTLAECNLRMLNTGDFSDVTFLCGTQGHAVKAHRYVLVSRSFVFHVMFSGPLAEKSDITVPEIEQQFFKQFLMYIYTDHTSVDSSNVTALLYAARKYDVTGLENKCVEYLNKNLTIDSACVILETAHRFDLKELFARALTIIKNKGDVTLKSPGFLSLSKELLDQIIQSDDLVADEHVVFTAINNWAEAECGCVGREVTGETKRSVLGETLMKVRFPLMEPRFVGNEVKVSGLLTDVERLKISEHLRTPGSDVKPFNTKKRSSVTSQTSGTKRPTISDSRFEDRVYAWNYISHRPDAISFQSNKNLMMYGYQLFGSLSHSNTMYQVTTYLGDDDTVMESVVDACPHYTYDGDVFDVMFSTPVSITAGVWYTLAVVMDGPNSWQGINGLSCVMCDDGVQIRFRASRRSLHGTDVSRGQIPALLYRLL